MTNYLMISNHKYDITLENFSDKKIFGIKQCTINTNCIDNGYLRPTSDIEITLCDPIDHKTWNDIKSNIEHYLIIVWGIELDNIMIYKNLQMETYYNDQVIHFYSNK